MGRQRLPADGTQVQNAKKNKMCVKTASKAQFKKKLIVRLTRLKKLIA